MGRVNLAGPHRRRGPIDANAAPDAIRLAATEVEPAGRRLVDTQAPPRSSGRRATRWSFHGRTSARSWHTAAPLTLLTAVVIVREFRSPATTVDGFVRELPGGSGLASARSARACRISSAVSWTASTCCWCAETGRAATGS